MHRLAVVAALGTLLAPVALSQAREPIIDMHLHALHADAQGPPPMSMCAPLNPIERAIAVINAAPFLSATQKRDISTTTPRGSCA